jgi:hypothetical protein
MSQQIDTIAPHVLVSNYDPTMTELFRGSFGGFLQTQQPGLLLPQWLGDNNESTLEYENRLGRRASLLTLLQTDTLGMANAMSALSARKDLKRSEEIGVSALIDERELARDSEASGLLREVLASCAGKGLLKGLLVVPTFTAEFASNWPSYDLKGGFGVFRDSSIAESPAFGAIVANHLIRNRLLKP